MEIFIVWLKININKKFDFIIQSVHIYWIMSLLITRINQELKDLQENPVQNFIEAWRGKTIEEDPDYYKRFNTYLGR